MDLIYNLNTSHVKVKLNLFLLYLLLNLHLNTSHVKVKLKKYDDGTVTG